MIIQINLSGNAYLQVQKPDLTFIYTVGHQFHLTGEGVIVTPEGYILQPPITVPAPFNEPIKIDEDGAITVFLTGVWQAIGQIMVAGFEHADMLEDLGDGYYGETDDSGPPSTGIAGVEPFEGVIMYALVEAGGHDRALVVLNIANLRKMQDFISKMHYISLCLSNNPDLFPYPSPALLTFNTHIVELEEAETIAQTHVVASAAKRNIKYDVVLDDVHELQSYVQTLADYASDMDTAIAIINASGFDIKHKGTHVIEELKVENSEVSGTVNLKAKAVEYAAAYKWQISTVGHIWVDLPLTNSAKTTVSGLIAGSSVKFRSCAVVHNVELNWTQSVTIIIT